MIVFVAQLTSATKRAFTLNDDPSKLQTALHRAKSTSKSHKAIDPTVVAAVNKELRESMDKMPRVPVFKDITINTLNINSEVPNAGNFLD